MKKKATIRKVGQHKKARSSQHRMMGGLVIAAGMLGLLSVGSVTMHTLGHTRVLGASSLIARGGDDTGGPSESQSGSGVSGGGSSISGGEDSGKNSQPQAGTTAGSSQHDAINTNPPISDRGRTPNHEPPFHPIKPPAFFGKHFTSTGSALPRFRDNFKNEPHNATRSGVETQELEHASPNENENQPKVEHDGTDDFVLKVGSVGAMTKFPLHVDPSTNEVTVTTSTGEKHISVLPDQAIRNLLLRRIISKVDDTVGSSSSVMITVKNNEPVFELHGVSSQRLFGLIPVSIHKSIDISTTTGQEISENETFTQRLLDILSI